MGTITSANAVVTLSVPAVSPTPIQLEGYATDDAFDNEVADIVETRMGVDGILSGGFTPFPVKLTFHFQADSSSIADIMDPWATAMQAATEAIIGSMSIDLLSVGRSYSGDTAFLTKFKVLPDAKKVLDPQTYEITFQSLLPSPLA
jgi:hypothetical protein